MDGSNVDKTLSTETRTTGKAINVFLGIASVALALYSFTFAPPYSFIAAGLFFCVGAVLLVFAIAHIRLRPDNKLRQAVIDHSGMEPGEQEQSKEERERESEVGMSAKRSA